MSALVRNVCSFDWLSVVEYVSRGVCLVSLCCVPVPVSCVACLICCGTCIVVSLLRSIQNRFATFYLVA